MSSEALKLAISKAGLAGLSDAANAQFEAYLDLLLNWNARLNLTGIRERGEILERHFVECIECAQAIPELPDNATLLDYGSGAGLPGIPIAICRPEIRVTLAESQGKKAAFLREAVRTLDLKAEVFDGRVEDMPKEQLFSVVTLRAVDRMTEACHSALSRIAPHGWMVLLVTQQTGTELRESLPEIEWRPGLPTVGLESCQILIGQLRA